MNFTQFRCFNCIFCLRWLNELCGFSFLTCFCVFCVRSILSTVLSVSFFFLLHPNKFLIISLMVSRASFSHIHRFQDEMIYSNLSCPAQELFQQHRAARSYGHACYIASHLCQFQSVSMRTASSFCFICFSFMPIFCRHPT